MVLIYQFQSIRKKKITSKNSRDFFNFLLSEHGQLFSYSLLIDFLKPKKFKIKYLDRYSDGFIKDTVDTKASQSE